MAAGARRSSRREVAYGEQGLRLLPLTRVARRRDQIFLLDARNYSSGQTFANACINPADLSPQTSYDYFLGATSGAEATDPTFNSAGDASYFSFDGGDYFTHSLGSTSTAFLKALHKTGGKFSVETWFYFNGNAAQSSFFDSGTSDQGGSDMSRGVIYTCTDTTFSGVGQQLRVKRDSAAANALTVTTTAAFTAGNIYMTGLSYEAGTSSFFYRNGAYDVTSSGATFTATLSTPGTADAANAPRIGARGDGANRVPSGTRLYRMALYNRALSKTDFDSIWSANRARFGL
jgi:hypothetical protein